VHRAHSAFWCFRPSQATFPPALLGPNVFLVLGGQNALHPNTREQTPPIPQKGPVEPRKKSTGPPCKPLRPLSPRCPLLGGKKNTFVFFFLKPRQCGLFEPVRFRRDQRDKKKNNNKKTKTKNTREGANHTQTNATTKTPKHQKTNKKKKKITPGRKKRTTKGAGRGGREGPGKKNG